MQNKIIKQNNLIIIDKKFLIINNDANQKLN